jgi:peptidoglycan hydrolase CwlO-like protein
MGEESQSELIGVRVTPTRKERLEEYVEEHGYDSVPSLFRRAVAHELSDDYGRLTGQQAGDSGQQLSEIAATVTHLQHDIQELSEEISALSEEIHSDRPSEVVERMSAVHRVLPSDESQAMDYKQVAEQFEDMSHEQAWKALMQLYEDGSITRTEDGWYEG